MNNCARRDPFLCLRKRKREAVLRKMAAMRAAKERKRLERGPVKEEPRMRRYYPLEFGVRVKATGETHFVDLRSVRHAAKALGFVLKYF